ncbi:hypothetical protein THRCLA_04786 [Thraustotheca clavata]|uniref:Uncharacterized protein n=1 Tax=Thraustotheca clavata TaxID=74557 RepID=A0A1V9ZXY3_9STRA|nr:hypothetical protein THRCLA_04786 [Thraustotheca clavata]
MGRQGRGKKAVGAMRYRKKAVDNQAEHSDEPVDECVQVASKSELSMKQESKIKPLPTVVHVITIDEFEFHPRKIVIPIGSTIRWERRGPSKTVHSISLQDGTNKMDSQTLDEKNATFEHNFNVLGEFSYCCSLYSFMTGSITVVAQLSNAHKQQNKYFLDYPRPQKSRRRSSPTIGPFLKQIAVWRAKQAHSDDTDDEASFAQLNRQRIKKETSERQPTTTSIESNQEETIEIQEPLSNEQVELAILAKPEFATVTIELDNFEFIPSTMTVAAGSTVVWRIKALGMVEHALQLTIKSEETSHRVQTPPLGPGDTIAYTFPKVCTIDIECLIYNVKSQIVVESSAPVLVIGDVECPLQETPLVVSPTNQRTIAPNEESHSEILSLFHNAHKQQRQRRLSYFPSPEDTIHGFDAVAAYNFLKQRANDVKNDLNVVYACRPRM